MWSSSDGLPSGFCQDCICPVKNNKGLEYNVYGTKIAQGKIKPRVILETGRFDNIDAAVIISSLSILYCLAYIAESMLSKRPVSRITLGFIFPP